MVGFGRMEDLAEEGGGTASAQLKSAKEKEKESKSSGKDKDKDKDKETAGEDLGEGGWGIPKGTAKVRQD